MKKYNESYKVPTQKYYEYLETSKSVIVSSKDATLTDRTHLKSKYAAIPCKSHDFLPEYGDSRQRSNFYK